MRAALYTRASTHDQQTIGFRIDAMESSIKDRSWYAARPIEEVGSGAKDQLERESLLKAARRFEVDVVVVWRLDRRGRSLADLIVTIRELIEFGMDCISLT